MFKLLKYLGYTGPFAIFKALRDFDSVCTILRRGAAVSKWCDMSLAPPPESRRYLVKDKNGYMGTAYYDTTDREFYPDGIGMKEDVTHWRPLV